MLPLPTHILVSGSERINDPATGPQSRTGSATFSILLGILPLLPCLFGGGIALWSRATLFALAGFLFLLRPPNRSLGVVMNGICVALLVLASVHFLPASWFGSPPWRASFAAAGIILPGTRSMQPFLSAEGTATFLFGICVAYYFLARPSRGFSFSLAARTFAVGTLALLALAVLSWIIGLRPPLWLSVENGSFGFFPNRNQTANFAALGGIFVTGFAVESARTSRARALAWLSSLALVLCALVLSHSRAGLLLFFGGFGVVIGAGFLWLRSKNVLRSFLIAFSVLVLLCVFFAGDLLRRFEGTVAAAPDLRIPIQSDALRLTFQEPWLGFGLGNFEPFFRLDRRESRLANFASHPDRDWAWQVRTLHPESDWLWSAVELGWLVPGLILAAVILWIRWCTPFAPGTRRLLRLAAFVGGLGFLLHGFADVSGHRLGSVCPALFLMALAVSPHQFLRESRAIPILFRALGVVFLALAAAGFLSSAGIFHLPTRERLWQLRAELDSHAVAGRTDPADAAATAALKIAPLEWPLYYQRGIARATAGRFDAALRDFRISRFLERARAGESFNEGRLWLALQQSSFALEAWQEALARRIDGGVDDYRAMLQEASQFPALRRGVAALAEPRFDFTLVLLESSPARDFRAYLHDWLFDDPALDRIPATLRTQFAALWARKGDLAHFRRFLTENISWQRIGWEPLAKAFVALDDHRSAVECARAFASWPTSTGIQAAPISIDSPPDTRSSDPSAVALSARVLLSAQWAQRSTPEALRTLATLERQGPLDRPTAAIAASLHAESKNWRDAWTYTCVALEIAP